MRVKTLGALVLATCLAAPVQADPEDGHPMVNHRFPAIPGLALRAPFALLVWRKADGPASLLVGESKLGELVSERPGLNLYVCEVVPGKAGLSGPDSKRPLSRGHFATAYLGVLKATRTPFITTVDAQGIVYRLNTMDHWPTMSVLSPRFGALPQGDRRSWWQTVRDALGI